MTEFLGGGVKQKSDSGHGQACSKFQHDGSLPNLRFILGISESPITALSDPRGDHAFTRALLLAGLELPCDAAPLQCRSSTKRGERRGGIAFGPADAAGLLLVEGELSTYLGRFFASHFRPILHDLYAMFYILQLELELPTMPISRSLQQLGGGLKISVLPSIFLSAPTKKVGTKI